MALSLSPKTLAMTVVRLCVMIDMLGISIVVPVMANYVRKIQGTPAECNATLLELNATLARGEPDCERALMNINANVGVVNSAYAICMLISSFWMPTFSDKVGRRPAIIVSIIGSFMGFILSACADYIPAGDPAFYYFIAIRCFGGLFGGTNTVANAFIVDLYDESERPKQFANLAAATVGGTYEGRMATAPAGCMAALRCVCRRLGHSRTSPAGRVGCLSRLGGLL